VTLDNDEIKELAVVLYVPDGGKGGNMDSFFGITQTYNVVSKPKTAAETLNGLKMSLVEDIKSERNFGRANLAMPCCARWGYDWRWKADLVTGRKSTNMSLAGYVLYLNRIKTIKSYERINNGEGVLILNF